MRANGIFAPWAGVALATSLLVVSSAPSQVLVFPNYTGSSNAGFAAGVSNIFGGANNGGPTFALNNTDGLSDILTSPGGGFQTINPSIANEVAFSGPVSFRPGQTQVFAVGPVAAYGNQYGPFGQAQIFNFGTKLGVTQINSSNGGPSASFTITGWTSSFSAGVQVPAGITFGNYIAMRGRLPALTSSFAMALRTFISSPNAGDPFAGGVTLPPLVLAYAGNGGFVAMGGANGRSAALITNGPFVYRGLAINTLVLPAAIPAGDTINVTSTFTDITDPAEADTYDPDLMGADNDLYVAAGSPPLPQFDLITPETVPEPGTLALLGIVGAGMAARRRNKQLSAQL